jgi:serine/threonine-protein kinase
MGVIMYECFAGSLPFQGESFMGILTQHITTEPEPVAQRAAKAGRALPMGLAEIITRCMQKSPDQRYRTMDELVNALIGVYRGIAGAGMSTYMEAFPVGASQHLPQPTPPPMMAGQMSGGHLIAPTMAATPSQPMHAQMSPTPPIGMAHASASGLYDPSGSVVTAPKKSKVGLIIAILVVLAAGGGIAAFVLINKGDDTKQPGNGSQVAVNDPGSAHATETHPDAATAQATGNDPWGNKAGSSEGSAKIAGSGDVGSDTAPPPPPPSDAVGVAIFTQPDVPFEVWENGAKVQDGMDDVMVDKGTKRTLVLKAKGFKDKKVTIDGTKKKLAVKLDRVAGATHTPPPPPPPGHKDCTNSILDPADPRCQKQYCATHEQDPTCGLM